ncbi:uncharacterized protein LOC121993967 [Zingiber officinale]|uniref:uncharacterized protein LOC121993967 n=1 Tax=Zingiber officinale TaxID=94328 RepID=UPI001C4AAC9A|nr:uncharacterized protein LOC121993967 [Zingiber officinale]
MELLPRDSKKLDQPHPMARASSEMEGRCRKHPEHRQSQGVCAFCLREKLSHLSASSSANSFAASSSSSRNSNLSSSPPSSQALAKPEPLRKSRSLAFTIGRPGGDQEDKEKKKMKTMKKRKKEEEEKKKKSKKGSFWSARWTLF